MILIFEKHLGVQPQLSGARPILMIFSPILTSKMLHCRSKCGVMHADGQCAAVRVYKRQRERDVGKNKKDVCLIRCLANAVIQTCCTVNVNSEQGCVCVCVCVCIRVWECLLTTAPLLLQVTAEGKWRRVPELTSALPVGVLPFLTVSSSFSRLILRCKCTLSPRKIYIYRKLRAFPTSKQRRKTRRKDD